MTTKTATKETEKAEAPLQPETLPALHQQRAVMEQTMGGAAFTPAVLKDVIAFGQIMAQSGPMVPRFCQGNPGTCCAITLRALRWGMDPFAVAEKSYEVTAKNGEKKIAYEAQLIHTVVNKSGILADDLTVTYEGEGGDLRCRVVGVLNRGKRRPLEYLSPKVKDITTKNSPLWRSDTEQQLHYFSVRNWGRRWTPEVISGVYTKDEIESMPITDADRAAAIDVLEDDPIEDKNAPLPTAPLGARLSYALERVGSEDEMKAVQLRHQGELDALNEDDRAPIRELYKSHLKRLRGQIPVEECLAFSKSFRESR